MKKKNNNFLFPHSHNSSDAKAEKETYQSRKTTLVMIKPRIPAQKDNAEKGREVLITKKHSMKIPHKILLIQYMNAKLIYSC